MGAKNGSPTKLMRDALMVELHREDMSDGEKVKRLRRVASALISRAIAGDVAAIKEINDRIDGKVPQATTISGDAENPLTINESISPMEQARRVAFAMMLGLNSTKDT